MAQIEGLEEQKDALKRINSNLKSIEEVNSIMKGIMSLSKDENVSVSYDITISFVTDNDIKRFKCPIIFDNNQHVLEAVQRYKDSIVAKVKEDSTMYRIALTTQEHAMLESELVSD